MKNWWCILPAVPQSKAITAYKRLRRVWCDPTRFTGKQGTSDRSHEFINPTHETHLTVTLWENFTLFKSSEWLPRLFAAAGLSVPSVKKAEWSYEWVSKMAGERMCDVVVEYETGEGAKGVLIVEAKALGKKLGTKDTIPSYYLNVPEFSEYAERRSLVYLVDENFRDKIQAQLGTLPTNTGVLTWQMLGGLQVELAIGLDVSPEIRGWIAGALQYQFLQHNIRPTNLSASYLAAEPSVEEVDRLPKESRQSMSDHYVPFWKIP